MNLGAFPIRKRTGKGRGFSLTKSTTPGHQQASSFIIDRAALTSAVHETSVELYGSVRLSKEQPGDLVRRMFGAVMRGSL